MMKKMMTKMIRPPMQPEEEEAAVSNDWDGEGRGVEVVAAAAWMMAWPSAPTVT
jgi:hypothetical protein